MERLINIDNGGLTDVCVWDGTEFTFTKTLTTPFDLSQCLFDGITKASAEIYGRPASSELLHSTKHIRRILFTTDRVRSCRIWSSVLNSFLHPTVERFLYNAEDRLRSRRVKNPLLIYRTDGASSRVAKSVASRRGRERKMLSAVLGMLAMLPVVFGVAGWAMVSR